MCGITPSPQIQISNIFSGVHCIISDPRLSPMASGISFLASPGLAQWYLTMPSLLGTMIQVNLPLARQNIFRSQPGYGAFLWRMFESVVTSWGYVWADCGA